jgi:hypothetical protein
LLRMTPGGLSFQDPTLESDLRGLPTAVGLDSAFPVGTELRRCHQEAR